MEDSYVLVLYTTDKSIKLIDIWESPDTIMTKKVHKINPRIRLVTCIDGKDDTSIPSNLNQYNQWRPMILLFPENLWNIDDPVKLKQQVKVMNGRWNENHLACHYQYDYNNPKDIAKWVKTTINEPRIKCPVKIGPSVDSEIIPMDQKISVIEKKAEVEAESKNSLGNSLKELKSLVGLDSVKMRVYEQLAYAAMIQDKPCTADTQYMFHTLITGPPGVGKTKLAHILTKIWGAAGIVGKGNKFQIDRGTKFNTMDEFIDHLIITNPVGGKPLKLVKATRADLIGKYIGDTAILTRNVVKSALGGVLFIDEAYSLINSSESHHDPFGMECLTMLNEMMTTYCKELIVIFAGYADVMEQTIFKRQPGLKRRFTWKFNIGSYDKNDLVRIFTCQSNIDGWTLDTDADSDWLSKLITDNISYFSNYAGDTSRLVHYCIINYSCAVLLNPATKPNTFTREIILNALENLKENSPANTDTINNEVERMYI